MSLLRRLTQNVGLTLMLGLVLLTLAISGRSSERIGDNIQIVLPLAGLACAVAAGDGVRYFGRFLLMETILHGTKRGLGEAPINQRPSGGGHGFPSGHMTAATFGAVGLIQSCLDGNKPAQTVAVLAAGYVGGSRIDAGAHNVWQVLAGALLGMAVQLVAIRWFDRAVRTAWTSTCRAFSDAGRVLLSGARSVLANPGAANRSGGVRIGVILGTVPRDRSVGRKAEPDE